MDEVIFVPSQGKLMKQRLPFLLTLAKVAKVLSNIGVPVMGNAVITGGTGNIILVGMSTSEPTRGVKLMLNLKQIISWSG